MWAWVTYHIGGSYTRNPWPGKDQYMSLTNGIMAISDAKKLSDIYMQLVELHVEAMLWFSLVDMKTVNAYNSNLKGYEPMLQGNVNYAALSWG